MIRAQRTKDQSLASKTNQKLSGEDCYIQGRLLGSKDKAELLSHPDYRRQFAEEWKNMSPEARLIFDNMALQQNHQQRSVDAKPKRSAKADSSSGVSGGKRKRAAKDSLAPKRNLSAFFHFSHAERPRVRAEMPSAMVGELAKELGRRWAVLPSDQKAGFQKKAAEDKLRYVKEKAAYENRGSVNMAVDLSAGKRGPAAPTPELGPSDDETDSD